MYRTTWEYYLLADCAIIKYWWIFVVYKDVLLGKQIGDGFLFPHRVLDSHQVFRILTKKINIMVQLAVGRAHEKKPCKLILAIFVSYFLFCNSKK